MRRGVVAILGIGSVLAIASSLAFAAAINIDALAGVYKRTFESGNIDGGKYQSENILEIVKVSPSAAYVRTHLEFFNGHVCNIWGGQGRGRCAGVPRRDQFAGQGLHAQREIGGWQGHAR